LTPDAPLPEDADRVVAAALKLVDAEGLPALTMRRLAQDMGGDAMALYRYAPSHEALLAAIAELVMGQLMEADCNGEWRQQLRAIAHDFRRLALAHPHVVPILVTKPLFTPLALRPLKALRYLERFLHLLTNAGFTSDNVLHVCRAYFGFLYGHVLTELHQSVVNIDETDHLQRLGLHTLPADEFPMIRSVAGRPATSIRV
jgi:AcrR family transcriptional regulator